MLLCTTDLDYIPLYKVINSLSIISIYNVYQYGIFKLDNLKEQR